VGGLYRWGEGAAVNLRAAGGGGGWLILERGKEKGWLHISREGGQNVLARGPKGRVPHTGTKKKKKKRNRDFQIIPDERGEGGCLVRDNGRKKIPLGREREGNPNSRVGGEKACAPKGGGRPCFEKKIRRDPGPIPR